MKIARRTVVGGIAAAATFGRARAETIRLPFGNGERPVVPYPQKRPLIRLTTRPPQLETPFAIFDDAAITPNDAFFVRYHLAGIPFDELDPDAFRLSVGARSRGHGSSDSRN